MAGENNALRMLESVDRIRRHWWVVLAGVCLGLGGGLIVLDQMPKTYEATTKILVAPQKIPQEFVRSTVTDDLAVRIAALREAVLSRPYLLRLIDSAFGRPADDTELERLINSIRSRVTVTVSGYNLSRSDASAYFEVSFRDSDPERTAEVVNTLAQLYIAENSRFRSARAQETVQTLEGLATKVEVELAERDRSIADFKAAHLYESAAQLEANIRLLDGRQRDLDANQKALAAAKDRLEILLSQPPTPTAGGYSSTPAVDPDLARLAALERELDSLKSRYFDNHPEVQAKERQIAELKSRIANAPSRESADNDPNRIERPNNSPAETVRREIARLEDEQRKIRADISIYSARIENTPRVEQQLAELTKGYEAVASQYREYAGKVQLAKGSQTIEEAQKGEQFEVIETAVAPSFPIAPVPLNVLGMGLIAGMLVFFAPLLLREVFRPVVRSEAVLEASTELPVLISIPRIQTPQVTRMERNRVATNWIFSILSVAALVVAWFVQRGA